MGKKIPERIRQDLVLGLSNLPNIESLIALKNADLKKIKEVIEETFKMIKSDIFLPDIIKNTYLCDLNLNQNILKALKYMNIITIGEFVSYNEKGLRGKT